MIHSASTTFRRPSPAFVIALLAGAPLALGAACTTDAPGGGANGVAGSAAGFTTGGTPGPSGGSPNGGVPGAGAGGSPVVVDPCTDCVEFGLEARPSNTTCLAGNAPPTAYEFVPIWEQLTFGTALGVIPAPDGTTVVVFEKNGIAWALPKNPAATPDQRREFLNLTSVIETGAESGLLSMAFHPSFAQNGFVYAVYTRNDGNNSTRVARFKSNNGGQSLDLASETKVYEHTQLRGTHHGGDMKFGPDGYLYVSFGDNNTGDDHSDFTAQNPDSLYGSLVRLDVNVPGEGYQIPPDNPYADGVQGAPEVYAKGFRNPWRFSFDRQTNEIWLADPGEEANGNVGDDGQANPYEEIDKVTKGGFYGWPFFQGTHCYHDCDQEQGLPPVFEYGHNGGPAAIVGGFVYRGSALPGLSGKYIFGDYEIGEAWALDPATKMRESLGFGGNIVAFGQDNDGEIYLLREGGDVDMLVDSNAGEGGFPRLLSETGCVSPTDAKLPASGLVPFTPALGFWSDGVEKARYVALPEGTTMEVKDGDLTLPVGGVTMKNFSWQGKLFETRFFVRHNDGSYYGYSYEWNAEGTDATLVGAEGKSVSLAGLEWSYPSTAQCFTCHSEAAGRSLGLETRQLNSIGKYGAVRSNQLNTLNHIGMLSGDTAARDAYVAPDITAVPIDVRARSYLAVNCSNCHRPGGPGRGSMNALFDTAFADMGVCNHAPEHGDLKVAGSTLLTPGNHAASVMWLRMSQRQTDFMPPIASKLPDTQGAELLAQWIDGLTACP